MEAAGCIAEREGASWGVQRREGEQAKRRGFGGEAQQCWSASLPGGTV